MTIHSILVVLHVLSVIVWLGFVPADLILRSQISSSRGKPGERNLISTYLKVANLTGIIGMTGVLLTGIFLVTALPYYSFFEFSSNHWLVTKQVLMIILILIVFLMLIPSAKKLRLLLNAPDNEIALHENETNKLNKVYNAVTFINILVLINFLLGITHRFF